MYALDKDQAILVGHYIKKFQNRTIAEKSNSN